MGKRTAYIGLSYPLLYDYNHQADKSPNDLYSSPNPIIESPLGLMILFDEILFLCRSVCPNNMRQLPYVKFVDELYPDLYFKGIWKCTEEQNENISINSKFSYDDIVSALNVEQWRPDIHTHDLRIGDVIISANSNEKNFLFDLYVFQALQNRYDGDIELITNSQYALKSFNGGAESEFIDRIIVPGIPNYVGISGPYHECMEELRENKYIRDFRCWIVEKHGTIQRSEIEEACVTVERNIEEVRQNVFKKYLEDNSKYSFFKSTGTTVLKTAVGALVSPISLCISAADVFYGCVTGEKKVLDAKSVRWQGFVTDARSVMQKIKP